MKVDAASGGTSPLFDAGPMEAALASLPGVTRDEASEIARSSDLTFNPARTGALVTIADDLYFYSFSSANAERLTNEAGEEEVPTFSPDGRLVAFVRGNNLHVVDIASHREQALTTDGTRELLNGKLDWLYQEEIYGRGQFKGYWWSPDSSRLAFLQLDEKPVPEYTVVDHIPYRPALEVTDYPKAGDPESDREARGRARRGRRPRPWVDLGPYSASEFLIVNVGWTPDSTQVVHQVQDREQTWLDLNLADVSNGRARRVLRETTSAWVNENGNPVWLKDGSFLWFSERSGFKHLYRYSAAGDHAETDHDGTLGCPQLLRRGRGEQRRLLLVGRAESCRHGHLPHSARWHRDDAALARRRHATARSSIPTSHTTSGVWSNVTTPTQVRLHRIGWLRGPRDRRQRGSALSPNIRLTTPEFVQVKTRDGFVMDANADQAAGFQSVAPLSRLPVHLRRSRRGAGPRPVGRSRLHVHSAARAARRRRAGFSTTAARAARASESQWPVYGRLGEPELQDLEDGVTWLKQQPYVDPSRLVLSGWSYGGFMTAYALTHSTSWSAGIVGAPVTDWRDYDSIYTERLMKLPKNNADGYRRTAPRFAAISLHGRMLLIHGTMDDNVHMQNSVQFAYELQRRASRSR